MKRLTFFLIFVLALPVLGFARLSVVASTNDLAYFAREIGGDFVDVSSVASPKADVHFVEVRPSYIVKLSRADVALKVGLELDMWMDRLIDGSRNNNLVIVDCSQYIKPLEVPTFKADARYGDLHRYGNPHYWLGPQNVPAITRAITEGLAQADPEHAADFRAARDAYLQNLNDGLAKLADKSAKLNGLEVVYYHNSWPYFDEFTGITAADFIEPYPGVPPSPSHIKDLTDLVRNRKIAVIAVEPYFDRRVPDKVAEAGGATVITLYPSVGGRDRDQTYLEWLEGNLDALLEAEK